MIRELIDNFGFFEFLVTVSSDFNLEDGIPVNTVDGNDSLVGIEVNDDLFEDYLVILELEEELNIV